MNADRANLVEIIKLLLIADGDTATFSSDLVFGAEQTNLGETKKLILFRFQNVINIILLILINNSDHRSVNKKFAVEFKKKFIQSSTQIRF